jgi:hypothetical protein
LTAYLNHIYQKGVHTDKEMMTLWEGQQTSDIIKRLEQRTLLKVELLSKEANGAEWT